MTTYGERTEKTDEMGEKGMRILFTGGGTGGHIYPALAIADRLQSLHPDWEIQYIGTQRGLESRIVPQRGIPFQTISVEGLPRKLNAAFLKAAGRAIKGCLDARKILKQYRPDLVIGTGGYVCGPIVFCASTMGISTMIHEQNAFPGITNKFLAHFADQIMVNFQASEQYFVHKERICVTGLPVRQEILSTNREEGLSYFGFSPENVTLLISGGSRGARSLNQAMVDAYPALMEHPTLQILHLTGATDYENTINSLKKKGIFLEAHPQIQIKPYLDEMQYALAAADFCVGRAGATFLAEITACGIPSILIPFPYAAENHQEYNARALVDKNAAKMILDKDLTGVSLVQNILKIYQDTDERKVMANAASALGKKDALDQIVKRIEECINRN